MSRFDLVFLIILDPQDEHYDKKLARHYRDQSQAEEDSFSMTVLRNNLKYAKQTDKPVLSDGALEFKKTFSIFLFYYITITNNVVKYQTC